MRHLLAGLLVSAGLLASPPAGLSAAQIQKGSLRILQNGKLLGSERYEIAATASEIQTRGQIEITVDDTTIRQSATLLLRANLAPRRYEWKMEEPEKSWRRLEFNGGQGTITFPRADGKEEQQVYEFGTTRVALLDLYHHFALLARFYDLEKGGPQTIRVFIPQRVQPGEAIIELLKVEALPVEGRLQPVRQFSITTEDNRVLLWVSEGGRFVRLQAPQQNVEVVSESVGP